METRLLSVLMIEDNVHDFKIAELALNRADVKFDVHWLKNPRKVLEYIDEHKPDLITLDFKLPGDHGLAVLENIISSGVETPIVIVTGTGNEMAAVRAMQYGAANYLSKDSAGNYLMLLPEILNRAYKDSEARNAHKKAREQEQLLQLERERMHIVKTFVNKVSHEIRTPLAILNSSYYLAMKTDNPSRREEYSNKINLQINAITTLIDHMSLILKLSDEVEFLYRSIDLNYLIQEITRKLVLRYPDRELDPVFELQADSAIIVGDSQYLDIALSQLIDNALQYSESGQHIRIRTTESDTSVIVSIVDSGKGMSEDVLKKIFTSFYRENEAHTTRGFGLGLPIAQKIIERQRGEISIQSQIGEGTSVIVKLPRK